MKQESYPHPLSLSLRDPHFELARFLYSEPRDFHLYARHGYRDSVHADLREDAGCDRSQ